MEQLSQSKFLWQTSFLCEFWSGPSFSQMAWAGWCGKASNAYTVGLGLLAKALWETQQSHIKITVISMGLLVDYTVDVSH